MDANHFIKSDQENKHFLCQGQWIITHYQQIKTELKKIKWPEQGKIILDGEKVTKMDSAGVWLLKSWSQKLIKKGLEIDYRHFGEQVQTLMKLVESERTGNIEKLPPPRKQNSIAALGQFAVDLVIESRDYLNFIGKLTFEWLSLFFQPKHWRLTALTGIISKTGCQALPIIALLSFMIGVVISYQMGNQLRAYGANVFIVNLLGLSILREFGPLITAIMVAGRTGSAFTAELGIMKINQEVDALDTMGVTPAELLLLPRIIGLTISLPLLTMWADIFGVIGGMVMANNMLGITWYDFLQRFQHEIPVRSLIIGLGKAPVFALLISSIGCFEGMQVRGSAESVGLLTTRSVVLGIFFIIVTDAIFSVIFSRLNL